MFQMEQPMPSLYMLCMLCSASTHNMPSKTKIFQCQHSSAYQLQASQSDNATGLALILHSSFTRLLRPAYLPMKRHAATRRVLAPLVSAMDSSLAEAVPVLSSERKGTNRRFMMVKWSSTAMTLHLFVHVLAIQHVLSHLSHLSHLCQWVPSCFGRQNCSWHARKALASFRGPGRSRWRW